MAKSRIPYFPITHNTYFLSFPKEDVYIHGLRSHNTMRTGNRKRLPLISIIQTDTIDINRGYLILVNDDQEYDISCNNVDGFIMTVRF